MNTYIDHYVTHILHDIRQDPALPGRLAQQEAEIVHEALSGQSIHEIARARQMPQMAVWEVLGNAARLATE